MYIYIYIRYSLAANIHTYISGYRPGTKHRPPVLRKSPTHNCTLRNALTNLRPVSESFRWEQPIAAEFDGRVLHRSKKSCIYKKIPPPPNFFVSYSPELVFFVWMGLYDTKQSVDTKLPHDSSVLGLGWFVPIWWFAALGKISHHTRCAITFFSLHKPPTKLPGLGQLSI